MWQYNDWSMRFVCWPLIGHNKFTLQTSADARLTPGSCTVQYKQQIRVYIGWNNVHMYSSLTVQSIVCAMHLNKNAVTCSILLGSKNVRKEYAIIFQLVRAECVRCPWLLA